MGYYGVFYSMEHEFVISINRKELANIICYQHDCGSCPLKDIPPLGICGYERAKATDLHTLVKKEIKVNKSAAHDFEKMCMRIILKTENERAKI